MESVRIFDEKWPVVFPTPIGEGRWAPTIVSCFSCILAIAEDLYGERDKAYTFLGIDFHFEDQPQLMWHNFQAKMQLTQPAFFDLIEAYGQCAHECIHLLSPAKRADTTYLEEGVAMQFQQDVLSWFGRGTTMEDRYATAIRSVQKLLLLDKHAIKKLRHKQPALSKIDKKLLFEIYPLLDKSVAENLVRKFYV